MEEERAQEQRIKVIDKRRFAGAASEEPKEPKEPKRCDGERKDVGERKGEESPSPEASSTESSSSSPSGAKVGAPHRADFSSLVFGMYTQAMVSLGEMPHPETKLVSCDLEMAKHFIDSIGMLEEKTRGNLSSSEGKLLGELLSHARMSYVSKTNLDR